MPFLTPNQQCQSTEGTYLRWLRNIACGRQKKICITVQGAREDVARVAVLLTDGQSSTPSLSTVAEATAAHQAGITIFSIGVSSAVNSTELQLIASSPRLYYHQWWTVGNFASLAPIQPLVARALCRPQFGTLRAVPA